MSDHVDGAPGQLPERQEWTTKDNRTLVIDYDHRGVTEVTREALTELVLVAGLTRKPADE